MRAAFAVACGLLVGIARLPRNSFAAEYDGASCDRLGHRGEDRPAELHIYLYVDAKDDQGKVAQWKFEGYPPNMLVRQGWKRDTTMKVGDTVTVTGWRARLDPHQSAAREVTFADGKKLMAGPPAGTGGQ
jgi:hypothetical protein